MEILNEIEKYGTNSNLTDAKMGELGGAGNSGRIWYAVKKYVLIGFTQLNEK